MGISVERATAISNLQAIARGVEKERARRDSPAGARKGSSAADYFVA